MDFIKLLSNPDVLMLALTAMGCGAVLHAVVVMLFKPKIEKLRRANRIKTLKRLRDYMQTNLNLVEENVFWRGKYQSTNKLLQSQMKTNKELGDVVYDLNQKCQTLDNCLDKTTALYNEKYLECDILKAEKVRRNSPAYSRSDKTVDKEGKIN